MPCHMMSVGTSGRGYMCIEDRQIRSERHKSADVMPNNTKIKMSWSYMFWKVILEGALLRTAWSWEEQFPWIELTSAACMHYRALAGS